MLNVKKFVVNPLEENCYVVWDDTRECVVIDCGAYLSSERQGLVDFIHDNHLHPTHHLLTHYHPDHLIGADTLWQEFSLSPEAHIDDQSLEAQRDELCQYIFGHPLGESFPRVGRWFTEKDTIRFGSHCFTIIHTPGHSPGGVFFYEKDEHIAFSGDTLFLGSIGRTDFVGGSMFQIIQSLRAICQMDDDVRVLPGHGPETTIGHECATNPYIDR